MTRAIIESSLRFKLLVVLAGAGVLLLGAVQLQRAPVDTLPEFTPLHVEIQTEALGLSASEVEQLITVPLEGDLLNGVAGIDVIRSSSVMGLSSIVLVFEPGTDGLGARQLVQERLIQAGQALPNVSKHPVMLQPRSASNRVMMIGLTTEELSPLELGILARWTIRPRLLGVEGVSNVVLWGHRDHQLQVQVDPGRLAAKDVTLQQVVSTTGNAQLVSPLSFLEASSPGTSGFVDTANQRLQIQHVLPIAEPAKLAQVPLEGVSPGTLRLRDVASVVEHHQPLIGDSLVDGKPGLMLVVEKFPGSNTLQVTRDVEAALDSLRPGLGGVEIHGGVFRPATYIETAAGNLRLAVLLGAVLAFLGLSALLFSWRAALVIVLSTALSVLAAALALVGLGETINMLTLAGLLLAAVLVLDDAIACVEAVWTRLRDGSGEPLADLVREATARTRPAAAFAASAALLAAVPVLFLPGPADDFYAPLVLSYALALLAATAVAITVTPALTLLLVRRPPTRESPLALRLAGGYSGALGRVVGYRRPLAAAVVGATAVAVVGGVLLWRLDAEPVPSFEENDLLVNVQGAPGTSRLAMVRVAGKMARELRRLEGVDDVGVHVGRAVMSDHVGGVNAAELWVSVDRDRDHDEAVGAIEEVVTGYPGIDGELVTYSDDQIRAVGAVVDGNGERGVGGTGALLGSDEPVAVRVYGKDLDVLRAEANKVKQALAGVEGVVQPRVQTGAVEPTVEVQVKLDAAAREGVKPGDVRRTAATLVQGIVVGSMFEEQKVFDVVVVGRPGDLLSLTDVRGLPVDTPSGDRIPLSEVAGVRIAPTPTVIERDAASRYVDVVADISGRGLGAVLEDVEDRLHGLRFPLEYRAELIGESSDRRAAVLRSLAASAVVALGAFLLLQAAFGSWQLAAVLFLVLPASTLGGLLAAYVTGNGLSLGALLGLFAVAAVTTRNVIQSVQGYQELEGSGESFGATLVRRGADGRLGAVLAGSVALALLVLPLAVLGSRPGFEIAHPMAVVILGGLLTSAAIALFAVPFLYLRVGHRGEAAAERLEAGYLREASS